jgi:hypothetical protein
MEYNCDICKYKTYDSSNYKKHLNSKKHNYELQIKSIQDNNKLADISPKLANISNELAVKANKISSLNIVENCSKNFICKFCSQEFKHNSSLSRHKTKCKNENNDKKDLQYKILLMEKEIDNLKQVNNMVSEFANEAKTMMHKTTILANKNAEVAKISAQTAQTTSTSALKYVNMVYKDAPPLLKLDNFKINNLDSDDVEQRKELVETIIYNSKLGSLDKLLGEHIVKYYKKEDPKTQSFHVTDCSRLNYLVRKLFKEANEKNGNQESFIWEVDKNGIEIRKDIINPLILKCLDVLRDHQKFLLDTMTFEDLNKRETVKNILDVIMSVDKGSLEDDVNKYIAPFFNLKKKDM